jgi:hypothetical protein
MTAAGLGPPRRPNQAGALGSRPPCGRAASSPVGRRRRCAANRLTAGRDRFQPRDKGMTGGNYFFIFSGVSDPCHDRSFQFSPSEM